jgi:hypothetical protein
MDDIVQILSTSGNVRPPNRLPLVWQESQLSHVAVVFTSAGIAEVHCPCSFDQRLTDRRTVISLLTPEWFPVSNRRLKQTDTKLLTTPLSSKD